MFENVGICKPLHNHTPFSLKYLQLNLKVSFELHTICVFLLVGILHWYYFSVTIYAHTAEKGTIMEILYPPPTSGLIVDCIQITVDPPESSGTYRELSDFMVYEDAHQIFMLPDVCPVIFLGNTAVFTGRKTQPQFQLALNV